MNVVRTVMVMCATLVLGGAMALRGAFDPTKTPIAPVPPERYLGGVLEPGPILSDNSGYDLNSNPALALDRPFYSDVVVLRDGSTGKDFLFGAGGVGLGVWDVSNAAQPIYRGYEKGRGALPVWVNTDNGNLLQLRSIDGPAGNGDLVAVAGNIQGFSAWNTRNKGALTVHYQDEGVEAVDVYVPDAQLAGRHWAFVSHNGSGGGLILYDLTAASSLARCLDESPGLISCGNVYRGEIGSLFSSLSVSGADHYVATLYPGGLRKVRIWDVSDPLSPVERLAESTLAGFTHALAMWSVPTEGGVRYYLAAQESGDVAIYDVSCIASGQPCSLGSPTRFPTPDLSGLGDQRTITISTSDGIPHLFIGNDRDFGCATQREYLLDVRQPTAPIDLTPDVSTEGFWAWYYDDCETGFNFVKPWAGRVHDGVLFRAAHSGLDTFRLVSDGTPEAGFTVAPSRPFVGQQACFTDTSSGGPTTWDWIFEDASPSTSSEPDPCVTFDSTGAKHVSLVAGNAAGTSTPFSAMVDVLSPDPQIASVTADVSATLVCGQVTFTANDVTGQLPISLSWQVRDAAGELVADAGNVNPFVWNLGSEVVPGTFRATAFASNPTPEPAMATSSGIQVAALPALVFNGPGGAPTADPFAGATVPFHALAQGATEWNWSFGDGTSTGWISDPVAGPDPLHTYDRSGTFEVAVTVRNCLARPITSATLAVTVESLRIKNFGASCPLGFCAFDLGMPVTFLHDIDGAPQSYDYDWNGDGQFEELSQTPVTEHVYCQSGAYEPVLRIRNGAEHTALADTNVSSLTLTGSPIPTCVPPSAPTGLSASPQLASIRLDWTDASTNEHGFRVLRSADGLSFFPIATLAAGVKSFTDTSPTPGVLYAYRIQVFGLTGVGDSATVHAQTTGAPPFFADGFDSGTTSAWSVTVP